MFEMYGLQEKEKLMDYLFIMSDCDECAAIKSILRQDVIDGSLTGINNQQLAVIYTFSNESTRAVLSKFDIPDDIYTPVILTNNIIISEIDGIIAYLSSNGFIQ